MASTITFTKEDLEYSKKKWKKPINRSLLIVISKRTEAGTYALISDIKLIHEHKRVYYRLGAKINENQTRTSRRVGQENPALRAKKSKRNKNT